MRQTLTTLGGWGQRSEVRGEDSLPRCEDREFQCFHPGTSFGQSLFPGADCVHTTVSMVTPVADIQMCPLSLCSCTRGWRCCVRCAGCTWRSCAGSVSATRSPPTPCSRRSTGSCSPRTPSCPPPPLTDRSLEQRDFTVDYTTGLIFDS